MPIIQGFGAQCGQGMLMRHACCFSSRFCSARSQNGVGIFKKGENTACAYGEFIHVFVNRVENKSVSIPENIRLVLEKLVNEN